MNVTVKWGVRGALLLGWGGSWLIPTDIPMILIFSIYVWSLLVKTPLFFMRYLMVFFMAIGNIVGVFICENTTIYLTELAVWSHHVGSLPLLIIGWFLFIDILSFWDSKYSVPQLQIDKNWLSVTFMGRKLDFIYLLLCGLLVIEVILSIRILPHPFFLTGLDRFLFHKIYLNGLWDRMFYFILTCIPIVLLNMVYKKDRLSSFVFGIYLWLLFWTGEKFGGFWNILVFFGIIYSTKYINREYASILKVMKKVSGIVIGIGIVVFLNASLLYTNNDKQNFQDYFLQRIAQQGQLWWRTYELNYEGKGHVNELGDEFNSYFAGEETYKAKYNHAIYKIMRFTTPPHIFERVIAHGNRYSSSTFASAYYYFKEAGVLLYPCIGASIFWLITYLFIYSVNHFYFVEILLSTKLLWLSYPALAMSEFNFLFSYKTFAYFFVLLLLLIVRWQYRDIGKYGSSK